MKRTRVVVAFETADILEVEEICLDDDAQAALRFVKERVKPQIDAAQKGGCDPQFHLKGSLGQGEPEGP